MRRSSRQVLVWTVVVAGAAWGEPPLPTMTLQEAWAHAQAHHPALRARHALSQAAASGVSQASAAWLPSLGAVAELVESTTNNTTATVLSNGNVDLARIGSTRVTASPEWAPSATSLLALGARQQVHDFGKTAAAITVARDELGVAQAREQNARVELGYAVAEAFFAVRAAEGVLESAQQAYERTRAYREFTRQAVQAQLRPPIELTRADAEVARAEVQHLRADGVLTSARLHLAAVVAYEGSGELGARRSPEEDFGCPPGSTVDCAVLPEDAAALGRAAEQSPVVVQARLTARREADVAQAAEVSGRPSLALSAAVSVRSGGAAPSSGSAVESLGGVLPSTPNYGAGLVLGWPLWDPALGPRVEAARARASAADDDRLAAEAATREAVLQATERARRTTVALWSLERAAESARANADQASTRFRAGLGTTLELMDSETLRTNADIALTLGRFEALVARAALHRALGETP